MLKSKSAEKVFQELSEPFEASELEWKPQSSGHKNSNPWVLVLAYVDNRAVQTRLDEVLGPMNWRNEYKPDAKGYLCGLSIRVEGEWITKWDGAEFTPENEGNAAPSAPLKGAMSNSMKRAAVHFGVGRYLYGLDSLFAPITTDMSQGGKYIKVPIDKYNKKLGTIQAVWSPPVLPDWALPDTDFQPYIDEVLYAESLDDCEKAYKNAYNAAKSLGKDHLKEKVVNAKEKRKPVLLEQLKAKNALIQRRFESKLNRSVKDTILNGENEQVIERGFKSAKQDIKEFCTKNELDPSYYNETLSEVYETALKNLKPGV